MSEEAAPVADFAEPEPSSLRLIFTLGIAGFFAGVVIVGIFTFTKPYIDANKAADLQEAVFEVVPDSKVMQELAFENEALGLSTAQTEAPVIYAAYTEDGTFKGYAIPGKGNGFQDTIKLIFGYDPAKKQIVGMKVLQSLETPGLGDKIIKDQDFLDNWKALSVEPSIVGVQKGAKANPNEVDCITGATISSKAVIDIINKTNGDWLARLPEAGHEIAYEAPPATAPQEEE